MKTYGNCFRINNLEIKEKKSIICIHDAAYISQCIELEKAFTGKYPFGYMGTSPWLGRLENTIPLRKDAPLNQMIVRHLARQSDVGIVLYYIDSAPYEIERFFDFTEMCFPNSLHLVCAGEACMAVGRKKGFALINHVGQDRLINFCMEHINDAAGPPRFFQQQNREPVEWVNFSFSPTFSSKRALLVGDSISHGYGRLTAEALPDFSVDLLNTSEGTAHNNMLEQLDIMMSQHYYDVIHINNGIHLHHVSNEEYEQNLGKIFSHIQEKSPNTKIVFATTTTVSQKPEQVAAYQSGDFQFGDRKPCIEQAENPYTEYDEEASARYVELNHIAMAVCSQMGIAVDDLFEVCLKHNPPKRDFVHFGEEGYRLLAEAVADSIIQCSQKKEKG